MIKVKKVATILKLTLLMKFNFTKAVRTRICCTMPLFVYFVLLLPREYVLEINLEKALSTKKQNKIMRTKWQTIKITPVQSTILAKI